MPERYEYRLPYGDPIRLDPEPTTREEAIRRAPEGTTGIRVYTEDGHLIGRINQCEHCHRLNSEGLRYGLCPDCQRTHRPCDWCNEIYEQEELTEQGGCLLCRNCQNNAMECDCCSSTFHCNDAQETPRGDLCPECYREYEEEIAHIHEYGYEPDYIFYPQLTRGELYLGVELETDDYSNGEEASEALYELSKGEDLFFMCDDSSLRRGIEIISHPATLDYHLTKFPWEAIINKVKYFGGKSHDTHTCGLHIHFSKDFLGATEEEQDTATLKLLYLTKKHWQKLVIFSRRTRSELTNWAHTYHHNFRRMDTQAVTCLKDNVDSHHGINITREDTIEVRLFKGTLSLTTLFACLELVDFLARLVKSKPLTYCYALSWKGLVKSIPKSRYPNLIAYLKHRGLMDECA